MFCVPFTFGGVEGVQGELLASVLERLGIQVQGRAILDVGCGRGFTGGVVESLGGSYTGADLVVSRAGFRLAAADAQRLPFADCAFDGVFCLDAFEHFPDPYAAAREFWRVLKPNGFVFLSAPNYANMAGVVKAWCETVGGYTPHTWAPFRQWQPQELEHFLTGRRVRNVFRRAGFEQARHIGYGPETGLGLCPWMAHRRMPEWALFRLQRFFTGAGPAIARMWPGASLHGFWRFDVAKGGR